MTDQPFRAGMRQLASALTSAFEATSVIQHRGAKGEGREEALANQLRPFLPRRYELSSGEVVNASGGVSKQLDLIISDALLGAPLIAEGRIGIHPAELVVGSIQVKSEMTPAEAIAGVDNLASLKALYSDQPRRTTIVTPGSIGFGERILKPFTGLVGYRLKGGWQSCSKAYLDAAIRLPPPNRPSGMVVLNDFCVLWIAEDGRTVLTDPINAASARIFRAGEATVAFFYVLMMEFLRGYDPPPLDLSAYFSAAGFSWSQHDVTLP